MKRLRLVVCTLLFVVSIFGALSTSHVFAEPAALPPNPTLTSDTPPNATPQGTPKPAAGPGGCSLSWSGFSLFDCLNEGIAWIIKNTLLQIAGFLVWVTANMFNYSVQIGVLRFNEWAPSSIYPIWLIVRQIVSLVIVFIGLYLGFMYILGKDDKFQRYIPWVIMFALFVNFSYPITRTMVDISNVISLNIYASAVGPGALNAGITDQNTAGGLITARLGLPGLIAGAVSKDEIPGGPDMLKSVNSIPAALAAVVFVLYASYIFLIVTGIFLMRTFVLVLLIVGSPILLVDSVFPLLGEKAKMLRKVFFEQLVVGPVFMIMFALTLKFLTIFSDSGTLASNFNVSSGDSTIKTFFNLIMMLVMLHVMIKVTKSTAGEVGNFASNAMGTVGGFAMGAAAGGTGFLARKGIGGLAMKARDSKWVTNNQDSFIGRRAYNLSNSVANSTFDIRKTAVAGKMASLGMGMGMGAKMGYEEETKTTIEKKKRDAIDARNRIKTHYERDKYKENVFGKKVLDENGQAILLHKKGEVNEEAFNAQRRFDTTSGGALFQTKKQKEAVDDALIETMTAGNEKIKGEIEKESSIDMSKYSSLKTKVEKANFVNSLNTQLADLQKTDKDGTGKQAKAVVKTLEDIKKKEIAEKEAFDTEVSSVFYRYNQKEGKDQKDYYTNQTKEVQDAMMSLQKKIAAEGLALDKEKDELLSSGLDIDLTPTSRESSLAAANNLRSSVEAILSDKPKNDAVDIDTHQQDNPVDVDITKPFNVVEQFGKASFAQRRMEAAQAARNNMAVNTTAVNTPSGVVSTGATPNKAVEEPVAV